MDLPTAACVLLAYWFAAFLKGITGLGFSTICIPILSFFLDMKTAIPLVFLPSLTSNCLVMIQAGNFKPALKRFWPIYLAVIPGLLVGFAILRNIDSSLSRTALGVVLFTYSLWALMVRPLSLSPKMEKWLRVPVGICTGFVNGITGSQVMPLLPFLLSLRLSKDTFVQAINLSFTCSTLILLVLFQHFGFFSWTMLFVSLVGIVPVALGIYLGGQIRRRLKEERFRQIVLFFLLVIGLLLAVNPIVA